MLNGFVKLNSKVLVKTGNNLFRYTIVSSEEVNLSENKISCEAPLGRSLLNHKVNDEVCVKTPLGKKIYQIVSVD